MQIMRCEQCKKHTELIIVFAHSRGPTFHVRIRLLLSLLPMCKDRLANIMLYQRSLFSRPLWLLLYIYLVPGITSYIFFLILCVTKYNNTYAHV